MQDKRLKKIDLREKTLIFRDILKVAQKHNPKFVSKTTLIYGANLNFGRNQKYLDFLVGKGFLTEKEGKYRITEKGETLLESIEKLLKHLG